MKLNLKSIKIMVAKINSKWKEVTIGGFSGILLGSAGTLFANNVSHHDVEAETGEEAQASEGDMDQEQNNSQSPNIPNNGAVATGVTDEMSFSEAFASARAELGAGGYFVWHGNVYGTYYAGEWNNMSEAEQNQFSSGSASVPNSGYAYHNTESNTQQANPETQTTQVNQQTTTTSDEDVDFQVLGVEHANIDGEHDSVIGVASMDGQAVYFIDVDGQDDQFEYMAADLNGNSQLDENEFVDVSDQQISVSGFQQMAQINNPQNEVEQYYANNENLPDYVNDADTMDLA